MHWYIHVLKNYVAFSGRARRKEYWYFMLFYCLSLVLGVILDLFTGSFNEDIGLCWISGAYFVATFLPALGVSVRRLHDIGRSGWWVILGLLPLVGSAVLLVLAIFDGQPGVNVFGPDPKASDNAARDIGAGNPGPRKALAVGGKAVRLVTWVPFLAVLVGASGWYWWQQHRQEFSQAAQQGTVSGGALDETGCLDTALDRVRASQCNAFDTSVVEAAWLRGCLKTSHLDPAFCRGVPRSSEVLPAVEWITRECARQDLVGQACPGVLQQVVAHCARVPSGVSI